jgi:hypothetical protein
MGWNDKPENQKHTRKPKEDFGRRSIPKTRVHLDSPFSSSHLVCSAAPVTAAAPPTPGQVLILRQAQPA